MTISFVFVLGIFIVETFQNPCSLLGLINHLIIMFITFSLCSDEDVNSVTITLRANIDHFFSLSHSFLFTSSLTSFLLIGFNFEVCHTFFILG